MNRRATAREAKAAAAPPEILLSVFQFNVLHPSDVIIPDLESALQEADTGNAVGAERLIYSHAVSPGSVPAALRKFGNDGTFFDPEVGSYHREDD